MKVLAMETDNRKRKPADYKKVLKDEAQAVWYLVQSGLIREIYFQAEKHTAVMIMEVPGQKEAEDILCQLPLAREGLIRFDVIPLMPYDGYARLFS